MGTFASAWNAEVHPAKLASPYPDGAGRACIVGFFL